MAGFLSGPSTVRAVFLPVWLSQCRWSLRPHTLLSASLPSLPVWGTMPPFHQWEVSSDSPWSYSSVIQVMMALMKVPKKSGMFRWKPTHSVFIVLNAEKDPTVFEIYWICYILYLSFSVYIPKNSSQARAYKNLPRSALTFCFSKGSLLCSLVCLKVSVPTLCPSKCCNSRYISPHLTSELLYIIVTTLWNGGPTGYLTICKPVGCFIFSAL